MGGIGGFETRADGPNWGRLKKIGNGGNHRVSNDNIPLKFLERMNERLARDLLRQFDNREKVFSVMICLIMNRDLFDYVITCRQQRRTLFCSRESRPAGRCINARMTHTDDDDERANAMKTDCRKFWLLSWRYAAIFSFSDFSTVFLDLVRSDVRVDSSV